MFPRFPRRLEFQHDECMDGQAPEDWCCNCAKAAGWDNIDPQLMYVRHACQSCRDSYYNSFGACEWCGKGKSEHIYEGRPKINFGSGWYR
mmetsp:Transcript_18032/g.27948  ORF Transcript_18032/g.27948 Transcript_18032/m.27948 type:complete len:90 (-) Transcript_18032:326-595(-)